MSLLDEFLKQSAPKNVSGSTTTLPKKSINSIDEFLSAAKPAPDYKPAAPYQAPPEPPKKPSLINKATALPSKIIQGAGNLLSKTYGPNIEAGLAESQISGAEKVLKPFAALVGGSSPDNLPFGIGEVIKGYKDVYQNPNNYAKFTLEDVLGAIVDTSKEFLKQPIQAGANLAGVPFKFNLPVLGEVSNRQFKAAQRIQNGEDPIAVTAEEGIGSIFDTMFLLGLANEVAAPRKITTNKFEIPKQDIPSYPSIKNPPQSMQSFKLYNEVSSIKPVSSEVIKKMISEKGLQPGTKYNPELPTYFKGKFKSNGNFVGEVVQVKPSYLSVLKNSFGTKKDPAYTYTVNDLKSSGTEFEGKQLEGMVDRTGKPITLVNSDGTLVPQAAQKVVSDLTLKLNNFKPGLGDKFATKINLNNPTTTTGLRMDAIEFLNNSLSSSPLSIPKVLPPVYLKSSNTTSIISKEIPFDVNKAQKDKVEQIIPLIQNSPAPDEHLIETAKGLAQESGDTTLVKKVEEAIAKGEKSIKETKELTQKIEQFVVKAQPAPEKELTEPMFIPYRPSRAIPVDRVYDPTGVFVRGTFEGKPYTSDSFILEFNSEVKAPKKVVENERGPAPDEASVRKIIPDQTEAVKVEPIKVQSTEDGKQSFVTLESKDGIKVDMQQKYYDYFKRKYPNAVFMAVEPNRPVVVNSGGNMVGLVMPANLKNSAFKLAPTWEKPKPVQEKLKDNKPKTKAKAKTTEKKVEKKEESKPTEKKKETKPKKKIRHFTKEENIQSILEKGFDVTKDPIHGTGALEGGKKTGKAASDVLYFTTDNGRWNTAQVFVGEGKGNISRDVFDYEKQAWVKEINAYEKVNLSPIEATIKDDAKILTIDSLASAEKALGGKIDIYNMIDGLVKAGQKGGYDIVNINNSGLWEYPDGRTNKFGNKDFYKTLTGNSGNDDYFVLNKDAIELPTLEPVVKAPRSSSAGDMSKGAGKIGNFEPIESLKEGSKPFKLHNEILAMAKKFNPNGSIMESKNMPHGAAGVRWGDTGNISTQGLNDLAIMSHELSHTIDIENKITDQLMKVTGESKAGNPIYDTETRAERQGLTKVYTTFYAGAKAEHPLKKRMREGYATLAQKYVEMPQTISKQFPELVQEFLLPGGKFYNPTLAAMIADSHKIASDYHNLSAIDKMGARVTDTLTETGKESFLNPIEKINYEMTDNIAPFEKLDQSLADQTRMLGYTINLIQQNIKGSFKYGTLKWHDNAYWGIRKGEPVKLQDFNWKTIVDSVGKENQLKFGYWLLGRATYFDYKNLDTLKKFLNLEIEMRANGQQIPREMAEKFSEAKKEYDDLKTVIEKDGITRQEATDAYNEGKDIFAEPAKMFDALNKEKINQLVDVGLMTKEQASEYLSKEGYASRKRDIYNEVLGDSDIPKFIRVGSTKLSFTMKRTGSSKAVINPLVSAIHDDIEATKKASRQAVVNKIGELGLEATYPDLIQRVALKTQVDKETGRITYPQEKQEGIMMARINGVRVPFEVDGLISQVFNELVTPNNVGTIGRFIQFFGRTFTKGTTGILSTFVFKNPVIDSITSLAQTQTGYIPVYDQIRNLQKIISNKDSIEAQYAREYMVFVGSNHTAMGIYDLTPEQQLEWVNGEVKGLELLGKKIEDTVNILTIPTQMTEIGTRMMEYINARKAGKPFARALEMAGQISAPFHHKPRFGGSNGMKLWVGNLPYARSAIQVTTQAIKTMARDKKSRQRYLLVWAAVIAAYVAAQEGAMEGATEEQKNLYKGLYGKQLARGVYFPSSDGKTLNIMPVSETMGWLAAMINMELMEMAGRTDYKIGDYAQAGTSFIPQQINPFNGIGSWFASVIPKPLDVGVGLMTNKKTYPAILDIESQSQQRLPAGMRFTEKTSPVAKWMGEEFNISPMKVDYLTTGLLGRAGNMVLGKESYWNFLSSFEQENYFTSSRLVQDFWETRKDTNEKYTAMKKDKDRYTPQEESEIKKTHSKLENIYSKLNDYGDLDIEKYPDKAEKQRQAILKEIEKLGL